MKIKAIPILIFLAGNLLSYHLGRMAVTKEIRIQYPYLINFREAGENGVRDPMPGDLWITDGGYCHHYTRDGWRKCQKPE